MKRLLLAALMSVAVPSAVFAADLYAKAPPPPVWDWTGLYFGGHLGGGWTWNDFTDSTFPTACCFTPGWQTVKSSGFLGGVQGGYNYQIGRFVIGSDFDFSWSGINGSSVAAYGPNTVPPPPFDHNQTLTADTNWLGTATTRLGVTRANWMFYSKIGVAWVHTNYRENNTVIATGFDRFDGTDSRTFTGWTVGTGFEWAFAHNWTARLEYDFIDLGNNAVQMVGTDFPGQAFARGDQFTINNLQYINEVKFGINYKFDPGWLFFW